MGIPNTAEGLDISLREGDKVVFRQETLKVGTMMLERGSRATYPGWLTGDSFRGSRKLLGAKP